MVDIDINYLSEAINDKMDRDGKNAQQPCAVLIERYVNGTEGYAIWSDGWCEQWGYILNDGEHNNPPITVNLSKTFNSIDYKLHIDIHRSTTGTTSTNLRELGYLQKNTSSFTKIMSANISYEVGFDWKASGMLAEGEY